MRAVAFLRNLNHGQGGAPGGGDLVAAFVAAGASGVRTVRGNGTVVLDAADPQRCTDDAVAALHAASVWTDIGVALAADVLAAALRSAPDDDGRWELSAFAAEAHVEVPLAGRRCTVTAAGPGWALTRNERDRESNATPTLERVLRRPVTSRAVATVRLALAAG